MDRRSPYELRGPSIYKLVREDEKRKRDRLISRPGYMSPIVVPEQSYPRGKVKNVHK